MHLNVTSFGPCGNISGIEIEQISTNEWRNCMIGYILIWTAIVGLLVYVPILYIMCTSKLLKAPCYSFMINLGISDVISLISWIIVGVHTATHGHQVPHPLMVVILCLLVIGWGNLSVSLAMIAVSIYIAVCHPLKQTNLFGWKRVKLLLAFCWFYAIAIHASPTFIPPNMVYLISSYICYWPNEKVQKYYEYEDPTFAFIVVALCLFCYLNIIVKYAKSRKRVIPKNDANFFSVEGRRQFKLALQTAIRFATFFIYDISYYIVSGDCEANLWVKFIFCTYLWCLNNALSPFIYLMFNMQIRLALKNSVFNMPILQTFVVRQCMKDSIKSSLDGNSGKH